MPSPTPSGRFTASGFDAFLQEIKAGCQARGCDWFLAKRRTTRTQFLRNCFLEREAT